MKRVFMNVYQFLSSARLLLRLFRSANFLFLKFAPPGHYYSPFPDIADVCARQEGLLDRAGSDIPGIDLNEAGQLILLDEFSQYLDDFTFCDSLTEKHRYWLDNEYFSYGDGVALYCFLRQLKPRKIIEVGSGYSSAEMLDLNEIFFKGSIDFVFVEPYPERLRGLLRSSDKDRCTIIEKLVQDVPSDLFSALGKNDILFIDSSHVTKAGSDVNHIVFNILPKLKTGVIVHFHDIPWPFEYPIQWIQAGRAWSEAYLVRSFLQFNNTFKILFFGSYLEAHYHELVRQKLPLMLKVPSSPLTLGNTSLWIQKVA